MEQPISLISYFKHTEIDRAKWDLCIEQSVNSMIYGFTWYLDKVSPGWEALIYGDYDAVMPLTHKKKYLIRYLRQPFFTQQLGIFSKLPLAQNMLKEFVNAIPKKFQFVEIQLNEQNQILDESLGIRKRKNYLLDLNKQYDKLNKGYSQQAKRNLKKAKKFELELKTIPYSDVVSFYKLHKAIQTKGVKNQDYKQLLGVMEQAYAKKKLISRGVYSRNNELLAAAAFLTHKNRLIFLLGTSSDLGKENGAMYQLFDYLIFQFANHKMTFDFEGSEIPGIAQFFKSFGAEKQHFYRLKINRLPWFLKLFKH
ncbi:MAG: hypothetical protein H7296_08975 [Bacteroidia bacterium]|nr:hypothetical protein [Bacteroidia bacterium]